MTPIQIVATIGPATQDPVVMRGLITHGMSLARLNFSWGTHSDHRQFVHDIRTEAAAVGVHVAIIQDLSGPRVQTSASHTFASDIEVVTEKDKTDIKALVDLEIEYIALSFVKDASDILHLREILKAEGSSSKIIAKIERQEALNNIDTIIAVADGIMIARGDLGDAVPFETVPFIQKDILKRCNAASKPVIIATGMLTSMIESLVPARADISDIAQAVIDGASATMLSNETAVGKYPVETVAVMRKIINEAQLRSGNIPVHF
jgi:pyruvate kinase